jgi:c-di-GMP-related signal transduction protein
LIGCVARQPIFDLKKNIYGYELLYRERVDSANYDGIDGNVSTKQLLVVAFSSIGIDKITGGHKAFVNFTQDLILDDVPFMLSNDVLVIEILEDVQPTPKVLNACRRLKNNGYLIALDDFVYRPGMEELIDLADIIKIDVLNNSKTAVEGYVRRINRKRRKILLAEKVETLSDFEWAKALGFSLFQGYCFSKPEIQSGKQVAPMKLTQLQLLRVLYARELDFAKVARIVERDVVLTYRLLRIVNSAYYGLKYSVTGVMHALTLLGTTDLRKWLSFIVLNQMNEERSGELVMMALIRGLFMEQIANHNMKGRKSRDDSFLIGLFSLADVILEAPMDAILAVSHFQPGVVDTLLWKTGTYADYLQIVLHYENAEWDEALTLAEKYNMDETTTVNYYVNAVIDANTLLE